MSLPPTNIEFSDVDAVQTYRIREIKTSLQRAFYGRAFSLSYSSSDTTYK